ncbi:fibroblast growth factor 19 [Chanos chanos]|uniref:Fibroblast growth factor n=1 Tax=Chanos chanos TaxID=29144 RepID=A0A6J2UQC0_CHACN|nr:fibroblast growth factor 19 [Chanos chanos]
MFLIVFLAFCGTNCLFITGVGSLPLPDSGPLIANDWGQSVRLRHLYAARRGLHLLIGKDGKIEGSPLQNPYSLVEITPVDVGFVAIRGVASSLYLCMERNGKLYGSSIYMKDDCCFVEQILPDGYNIYISHKHGTLVSLNGIRNKTQRKDLGAFSQFLPMTSTLSLETMDKYLGDLDIRIEQQQNLQSGLELDNMDPFRKVSQIVIQSPSFNKR